MIILLHCIKQVLEACLYDKRTLCGLPWRSAALLLINLFPKLCHLSRAPNSMDEPITSIHSKYVFYITLTRTCLLTETNFLIIIRQDILSVLGFYFKRVYLIPKQFKLLASYLIGYILVLLAFVTFVLVNGSIVVGDKHAHEAALHLPQVISI